MKNILAATAAVHIIKLIRESDKNDDGSDLNSQDNDDDDYKASDRAKQAYRLLLFLSAVTKGYNRPIILMDPPDTDILDAKQTEVQQELDGNHG